MSTTDKAIEGLKRLYTNWEKDFNTSQKLNKAMEHWIEHGNEVRIRTVWGGQVMVRRDKTRSDSIKADQTGGMIVQQYNSIGSQVETTGFLLIWIEGIEFRSGEKKKGKLR